MTRGEEQSEDGETPGRLRFDFSSAFWRFCVVPRPTFSAQCRSFDILKR